VGFRVWAFGPTARVTGMILRPQGTIVELGFHRPDLDSQASTEICTRMAPEGPTGENRKVLTAEFLHAKTNCMQKLPATVIRVSVLTSGFFAY